MAGKSATIWSALERSAWEPPPDITVSEWADEHRRVVTGAEQGPWRTSRVPYLKAIMDAYTDPEVEEITITGPAQSAKTEAVFNMILYSIDCDPVPCLYVTDTDANRGYIAEDRLKPSILGTPATARHATGRPWDLSGDDFRLDRMNLYFGSSQSISSLVSKAIGRLFVDETDKFRFYVGREGNPIQMAYRRGQTYQASGDFKAVYLCTMTTENGYIWVSLGGSNFCEYPTPCPRCGEFIRMRFDGLKVDPPDLRDPEIILREECVYYKCQVCSGRVEQYEKGDMVENGIWCPKGQTVTPEGKLIGVPERGKRHSGFWIGEMISPWLPWHRMLAEFFKKNTPEGIAQGVLREFVNQVLAQPWKERGKSTEEHQLADRRGDFSAGTVPDWVLILVAYGDYHEDEQGNPRIDYVVKGFGYFMRSATIKAGSCINFEQLEGELFRTPFIWSNPERKDDPKLEVVLAGIDARFKGATVFGFCDKWRGRCVPMMGGKDSQVMPVRQSKIDPVQVYRKSRRRVRPGTLYTINTKYFKDMVAGSMENPIGGANSTEYFAEAGGRFFRELCNEHRIEVIDKKTGRKDYHWEPVVAGRPTHFWDCEVGCAVAAYLKNVQYMQPPSAAAPNRKKRRRTSGFLDDVSIEI